MKQKLYFLIAICTVVLIDAVTCLLSADPKYWSNYNDYGVEYNPIGAYALHHGPFAFALLVIIWMAVIGLFVWKLPRKLGFIIGSLFWIGHMMGSSGQIWWLLYSNLYSQWYFLINYPLVIYVILMTIIFTLTSLGYLGFKILQDKPMKKVIRNKR